MRQAAKDAIRLGRDVRGGRVSHSKIESTGELRIDGRDMGLVFLAAREHCDPRFRMAPYLPPLLGPRSVEADPGTFHMRVLQMLQTLFKLRSINSEL